MKPYLEFMNATRRARRSQCLPHSGRGQSFTRTAAKLGTSQSSLSHTIRRLEAKLGVRLLTRTTRSVAPTEAGERLLGKLRPALDSIGAELASLSELREKPAGTIRITTSRAWGPYGPVADPREAAAQLSGRACRAEHQFEPDRHRERAVRRRRAPWRSACQRMIAVRIGPDLRMVVVGSPAYFARWPIPRTPHNLAEHQCINLRFLSGGGLYAWDLEKDGQEVRVRVERKKSRRTIR